MMYSLARKSGSWWRGLLTALALACLIPAMTAQAQKGADSSNDAAITAAVAAAEAAATAQFGQVELVTSEPYLTPGGQLGALSLLFAKKGSPDMTAIYDVGLSRLVALGAVGPLHGDAARLEKTRESIKKTFGAAVEAPESFCWVGGLWAVYANPAGGDKLACNLTDFRSCWLGEIPQNAAKPQAGVAKLAPVASAAAPAGAPSQSSTVGLTMGAAPITGVISYAGENDWFAFSVPSTGIYTIESWAGSLSDNIMYLYGPNSSTNLLESDDDDGIGFAAKIGPRTLSSGTYYVRIRAYSGTGTGTYTIQVRPSLIPNASAVTGSISPAGNVDWYQFVVPTAGSYTIETWAGSLIDNYMYLYGPNSQTALLETDDDDGVNAAARITRTLAAGTYYVMIRAYSSSSTGTYTIQVRGTATQLTPNASSRTGTISFAGEQDWYSFTVPSTGLYTIETWAGSLTDNYMYLYGPNSQSSLIESDDDDGVGNAALIGPRTLAAGTYYVMIRAYSSSGMGTYSIQVRRISTLSVNGGAITGSISPAGDQDWYRFTVPSSGVYTIETWAGSLSDNYMYLYGPNSQTNLLESDDDDGVGNAALIGPRMLAAGTYYVRIQAYSSSGTGTYTIQVRGGVTLTVNALPVTESITNAGDTDWFSFSVPSTGSYIIETWAGTLTDNQMWLFGPNNQSTLIQYDDDDGTGNAAFIGPQTLSAGTYYIRVKAYNISDTGTYSIQVRRGTPLTVNGSVVTGNISPAGDVDWYSFTVTYTNVYTIETWAGSLSDNYMSLYGPTSPTNLIETDDDDGIGNAALIGPRILSAGTYYIAVRAYSSSGTGSYTIQVRRPTNLWVNDSSITGSISQAGEQDWYSFYVPSSGTYTIETWSGSLSDNYMYLYGPNSQTSLIETDDDDGTGYAARIVRYLSSGTYYVMIRAYSSSSTGTYTIRVTH